MKNVDKYIEAIPLDKANLQHIADHLTINGTLLAGIRQAICDAAYDQCTEMHQDVTKLQKFKQYVHDRLDKMGIPADPDPESNAAHGCRIEGRLNFIESRIPKKSPPDPDGGVNIESFSDLCEAITMENKDRLLKDLVLAFTGYIETITETRKMFPEEFKDMSNSEIAQFAFVWYDDGTHDRRATKIETTDGLEITIKHQKPCSE